MRGRVEGDVGKCCGCMDSWSKNGSLPTSIFQREQMGSKSQKRNVTRKYERRRFEGVKWYYREMLSGKLIDGLATGVAWMVEGIKVAQVWTDFDFGPPARIRSLRHIVSLGLVHFDRLRLSLQEVYDCCNTKHRFTIVNSQQRSIEASNSREKQVKG